MIINKSNQEVWDSYNLLKQNYLKTSFIFYGFIFRKAEYATKVNITFSINIEAPKFHTYRDRNHTKESLQPTVISRLEYYECYIQHPTSTTTPKYGTDCKHPNTYFTEIKQNVN